MMLNKKDEERYEVVEEDKVKPVNETEEFHTIRELAIKTNHFHA